MAKIRTRTSEGYQQVELTSELLHGQSGATQQVISTVPCSKHLPFFFSIILADVLAFMSVILFAIYATQYGDGLTIEAITQPQGQPQSTPIGSQVESQQLPAQVVANRQYNLHALIMLVAFVYINGQAIVVYKSNYLVKHKSLNMLHHFIMNTMTTLGILAGLYATLEATKNAQAFRPRVSHFYSIHSWVALITIGLFTLQFLSGVMGFLVALCCRKVTARFRSKAQPIHKMLTMITLCVSVATIVSGLNQLARIQLNGASGRDSYMDMTAPAYLLNLSVVCVIGATILVYVITYTFKRRQAYDLPVLFKIILLVTQFVEFILILVVGEFVFQLVTPHVNRVINTQFIGNTTLNHIFNNATQSIGSVITGVKQLYSNSQDYFAATANSTTIANNTLTTTTSSTTANPILLGPNLTSAATTTS